MASSDSCIKFTLFVFNFFFVISGIIMLAVGLSVQGIYHGYTDFLDHHFVTLPVFLIVIGSIIFFVAFFGCYGAWRENYCFILMFCGLLIIIFILELAAGITGFVLKNSSYELVKSALAPTMEHYTNQTHIAKGWNQIHENFDCCGLDSFEDWDKIVNGTPLSCCKIPVNAISVFTCDKDTESLRKIGCVASFGEFIQSHASSLAIAGIVLAFIQLLGLIFACLIARRIKKNRLYN